VLQQLPGLLLCLLSTVANHLIQVTQSQDLNSQLNVSAVIPFPPIARLSRVFPDLAPCHVVGTARKFAVDQACFLFTKSARALFARTFILLSSTARVMLKLRLILGFHS